MVKCKAGVEVSIRRTLVGVIDGKWFHPVDLDEDFICPEYLAFA